LGKKPVSRREKDSESFLSPKKEYKIGDCMSKLPLAPFEKILKESRKGIRVSDSATKEFVFLMGEIAKDLAYECAELAEHANRKTILDSDVKLAGKRRK